MSMPSQPKIYHIVHMDRLRSIIEDGFLWSDARMTTISRPGTTIGLSDIKRRRLQKTLTSYPDLHVGDCVPFYFCPRSVMLFYLHMANSPQLEYRGGQHPIVHLEADLHQTVEWAEGQEKRWAFTLSNAGSYYFDDYADLADLDKLKWADIRATQWQDRKEGKQAEFLVEWAFPWELIARIGVHSPSIARQVQEMMPETGHRPAVVVIRDWYY